MRQRLRMAGKGKLRGTEEQEVKDDGGGEAQRNRRTEEQEVCKVLWLIT